MAIQEQGIRLVSTNKNTQSAFINDGDQYILAAEKLYHSAKAHLLPFEIQRVTTWIVDIAATVAMALLTYVVLTSVLSFPIVIAFLTALVVQMVGIYLTHGHFETVRATDNRFSWYFWAAVAASCVMLAIAYLRAQMYVQDMDINPVVACIVSLLVATIEPGATWVLGAMTAGAQWKCAFNEEILVRARTHRESIANAKNRDITWQRAIGQVDAEIGNELTQHLFSLNAINKRNDRICLLEEWRRELYLYYPNHGNEAHGQSPEANS